MPAEKRILSLKLFRILSTWYNEKHFSFKFPVNNNIALYCHLHPGEDHGCYCHCLLCPSGSTGTKTANGEGTVGVVGEYQVIAVCSGIQVKTLSKEGRVVRWQRCC